MSSINSCILEGHLSNEPITRAVGTDNTVINFPIAVNKSIPDGNGGWKDDVSFFDIVFWTKKPDHWLKQLYKGSHVILECEAKQQTWEKDGQTRSKVVFKITDFPRVISKPDQSMMQKPAAAPQNTEQFKDDIPF